MTKRILSDRQRFINKINARIRAQVKAGVSRDLIDSEILDAIDDVSTTKGGITIKKEDFTEELQQVLEQKVKTMSELIKSISSDAEAYNVENTRTATREELIGAYNSRQFMNKIMDGQFKKYYDLVVNNAVEAILTSPELSKMKDSMGDFARALRKNELAEAKSIYDKWLSPLLQGKTIEEIESGE